MPLILRRIFPLIVLGLLAGAILWAVSFGTLPPADFTFDNGTEIETVDPALSTGQPENRIINGLFEGLLRNAPPENWSEEYGLQDNVPLTPGPGMATHFDESPDGLVYTFHMNPAAQWSSGERVTAEDFAWSWMRTLHPETPSKYSYQLHYLVGAKEYNLAQVKVGDLVEVELADRRDELQLFPRGTILRGKLTEIHQPPAPKLPEDASEKQRSDAEVDWKKQWVYAVELDGKTRLFAKDPAATRRAKAAMNPAVANLEKLERAMHVLPDFDATVGVKAEGPDKLVVRLKSRTPYFPDLVAFYPLYPVNRKCIEEHGTPNWTQPENIVSNGPFQLEFRRIRDRIRLAKSDTYWDKDNVKLNLIDALAIKGETTSLNMYMNGQLDWSTQMPISTIPKLKAEFPEQFRSGAELTTYFYRFNVKRPELADKRVRRAMAMAIDKQSICERVTRAGEAPATAICPPGMAGYDAPQGAAFDVQEAQRLLAEAGFPKGKGLPPIEILYNDMDAHKTIAETIQQMWKQNLGIDTVLRGLEWGVYLDTTHKLDYDVCRAGWIADYSDPNTFLDMFVTDGENNQTGWSNARYDELIRLSASEPDAQRRMEMLREAETILLDEQPILPIYFRVTKNLVNPRVKNFFNSVQDEHPLKLIDVAQREP
ncbi:MAG: peptide ABC transporter substrate-binding protein [Pirellulaceae bacterium]|nr:peptide ABC transporter substrate-binding protein [Pirellulaceae bacterium]